MGSKCRSGWAHETEHRQPTMVHAFVLPVAPLRCSSAQRLFSSSNTRPRPVWVMSTRRSVVWIRPGDMRTVDHAGLTAAAVADVTAAVAIVQPDSDPAVLLALSKALEARGTTLSLCTADSEPEAIAKFAQEFRATSIHVREDETNEGRRIIKELESIIPDTLHLETWKDSFRKWDESKLAEIPYEYPGFLKWGERTLAPVLPSGAGDVLRFCSSESDLPYPTATQFFDSYANELEKSSRYVDFLEQYKRDSDLSNTIVVDPADLDADAYGERLVRAYLEAADAYKNPDMGRSLAPLFSLGLLSSRRIYEVVLQHERENGRIFSPIFREGAKRLLNYLDSREFSQLLARQDLDKSATVDGVHVAKFWRWRGYLVRYVDEGPIDKSQVGKPPLVLVHGFGASSQHWRRSVAILKKQFRVIALDVVGYGRSEKTPTAFTPDHTECVIWEFIRDVVGEPVFIAGNSIGGYFSAAFASDSYPELCAGVVLVNSAGKIETSAEDETETPRSNNPLSPLASLGKYILEEWKPARKLAANVVLHNLRGSIGKTLKKVYPINPDQADEQLSREIYRNSLDFGADEVLASGLVLPSPRTLTALLSRYTGPLLIYQGVLDPLNGSGDRAMKIQGAYPAATLVTRNLGHCPHDEDAEDFAETISAWMESQNAEPAELMRAECESKAVILQ